METDFIKQLKKQTATAIKNGKNKAAEQNRRQREAAKTKKEANIAQAKAIVAKIPNKASKVASEGKSKVQVYRLKTHDISGKDKLGYRKHCNLEKSDLSNIGKLVYAMCEELGFVVTIEYDHDGVGMESWNDIYVNW